MRRSILALSAVALIAGSGTTAVARSHANQDHVRACAAQWSAMKKSGQAKGQTYRQFSKTCLSGGAPAPAPVATPAQPAPAAAPARAVAPVPSGSAATAKCRDGSLSYAKHHSGACSHHGGVAQWMG